MDPALVSVLGIAKDWKKVTSSDKASSTPGVAKVKKIKRSEELSRTPDVAKVRKTQRTPDTDVAKDKAKGSKRQPSSKPSTDSKLEAMDQKWSEKFRRLEDMLLSKTSNQNLPSC